MSKIIATLRAALITLAVTSPAFAQTPRDVAHLLFQQTVPTYVSTAPAASINQAGAASATDLARLLQTDPASLVSNAPSRNHVFTSSFAAQDVARLSSSSVPGLFAISNNGITIAEDAHN